MESPYCENRFTKKCEPGNSYGMPGNDKIFHTKKILILHNSLKLQGSKFYLKNNLQSYLFSVVCHVRKIPRKNVVYNCQAINSAYLQFIIYFNLCQQFVSVVRIIKDSVDHECAPCQHLFLYVLAYVDSGYLSVKILLHTPGRYRASLQYVFAYVSSGYLSVKILLRTLCS